MQTKQSKDKIDMELTRTYFGDPGAKSKKENQNPFAYREKPKFFSPVMVTLLVLVVILIAFFVFLVRKNVSLEVNINVEAVPTMQKSASKTSSGLLLPWQKEKTLSAINRTAPLKSDEKILYGFEEDTDGWDIPGWTSEKEEYVGKTLDRTSAAASEGRYSLKMATEFPANRWTGAIIEVQHYLDLGDYNFISIDVLVPKEAPRGLQAKLILTVGESWKFVEMSRGVNLRPGEWTTIKASLSGESTDWKRTKVDDVFKKDVRKIALRVESNNILYTGPVYIDDVRLSK